MTVILVGCGKTKAPTARPARDLYIGVLFRAARAYAEAEVAAGRAVAWAILSGKHRVVAPDAVIAPYDFKLSRLGNADDPLWGRVVLNDAHAMARGADLLRVVVLAGAAYVDQIRGHVMPAERVEIVTPLEGMGVGERLGWFKAMGEARVLQASLDRARARAQEVLDAALERDHADAIEEDAARSAERLTRGAA